MSNIINDLKSNQFNSVNKSHLKCPLCNSDLYTVSNTMVMVYDGNMIYHCVNNKDHVYWKNSREVGDVLHLNKLASETDFRSDMDFELKEGKWIETKQ